jgi:hypothetical protein
MYYTLNPRVTQPTWVGINAPSGATWGNVVGLNSLQAFGNVGTVLYEINLSNGVSTVVSGAPAISNTPNNMTVTSDNALYIRSNTSTAKGNFWVYFFGTTNAVWYNMVGTIAIIGGNVSDALFAQNGSASLYHYLKTAVAHTSTVKGYYDCGTTGCPAGAVHTAIATGHFLHGTNTAASYSVTGAPATTLIANYSDVSGACDPMFGDPTSTECYISQTTTTINNQVKCSVMGLIYSAALATEIIKWEWAYTRVYSLKSYTGCETDRYGVQRCAYNVDNWCANTAKPDLDMHNKAVTDISGAYTYWELKARCVNFLGTGWGCSHAFGPGFGGVLPPPAPDCTYNP